MVYLKVARLQLSTYKQKNQVSYVLIAFYIKKCFNYIVQYKSQHNVLHLKQNNKGCPDDAMTRDVD